MQHCTDLLSVHKKLEMDHCRADPSATAGGNTASGLPLGNTVGSLLSATGGSLTDRNGSVLNLKGLLSGASNATSLDSLGLGLLNLNVSALVPDISCPNGGLLNADLNLAGICVGAQVVTSDNVANVCVQQASGCCCSPGDLPPPPALLLLCCQ